MNFPISKIQFINLRFALAFSCLFTATSILLHFLILLAYGSFTANLKSKRFYWGRAVDYSGLYPDETLTSFIVRQLYFCGYPHIRIAQKDFWSSDNLQINSPFPSLIPWISDNYGIYPIELLDNHTCLNYFKPYLGQSKYELIKQELLTGDVEFVQKWLGITSNRVKEGGSLYYCPVCK